MVPVTAYGAVTEAIQKVFNDVGILSKSITMQRSDSEESTAWYYYNLGQRRRQTAFQLGQINYARAGMLRRK